jgi:tetratricopeptide (TPR) repeat protein
LTESAEQLALRERLERGQTLLLAARDSLERLKAYLLIGDAQHDLAEYAFAQEAFSKAEALARLLEDPQWIAEALVGRVRVAGGQSQYTQVQKAAREAVLLARQAGDSSTLAKALYWLGNTEFYLGRLSTARGHLEESLKVVVLTGDSLRLASTMTLLGRLEGQAGRLRRRIELLHEALKINTEFGYQKGIAMCLTGLSWSTLLDGQFSESERLSEESLALFRQQGSKWAISNALLNLGHAQAAQGKISAAKSNLLEAYEIAIQINSTNLLLEVLLGAARVETNVSLARQWVRVAVMHPNSTSELRSFAASDIERLEVALKPVDEASLSHCLPEVKASLETKDLS